MESEYLTDLMKNEELYEIVELILPKLRALDSRQIETFIFYLKSLHSYYPASENCFSYHDDFDKKLDALRESECQKSLQIRAARLMWIAMALGGIAIIGLLVSITGIFFNSWPREILFFSSLGMLFFANARFGKRALEIAKEQDRRYFLESIRAARACSELDWAGLFSYNGTTKPGPQSDADIKRTESRVADLTVQLRNALYNDEYREYSHQK